MGIIGCDNATSFRIFSLWIHQSMWESEAKNRNWNFTLLTIWFTKIWRGWMSWQPRGSTSTWKFRKHRSWKNSWAVNERLVEYLNFHRGTISSVSSTLGVGHGIICAKKLWLYYSRRHPSGRQKLFPCDNYFLLTDLSEFLTAKKDHRHIVKVCFYFGYCSPTRFQPRVLGVWQVGVWVFFARGEFVVHLILRSFFYNKFLRKIPFIKMHRVIAYNHYSFWHIINFFHSFQCRSLKLLRMFAHNMKICTWHLESTLKSYRLVRVTHLKQRFV